MSKSKNQKVPKARILPPGKKPRYESNPEDANRKNPVWSVVLFDTGGPWGRERCERDGALWNDIFPKMRNYESMTWGEILQDRKRNHSVNVEQLLKEARKRLTDLKLDDIEELFRFRLTGEQRVWGIREREVFRILWWDPDHEICPSPLRNT